MATTFSPKTYVDESNDPAIDATNLNINEQATYSLSLDTNTLRKVSKGRIDNVPLLALTLLNGKVLDSPITVGTNPIDSCFDGTYVYVANTGSNNISVIDTSTHTVYTTVTVGTGPIDSCFDGTYVYVANYTSNNISILVGL